MRQIKALCTFLIYRFYPHCVPISKPRRLIEKANPYHRHRTPFAVFVCGGKSNLCFSLCMPIPRWYIPRGFGWDGRSGDNFSYLHTFFNYRLSSDLRRNVKLVGRIGCVALVWGKIRDFRKIFVIASFVFLVCVCRAGESEIPLDGKSARFWIVNKKMCEHWFVWHSQESFWCF